MVSNFMIFCCRVVVPVMGQGMYKKQGLLDIVFNWTNFIVMRSVRQVFGHKKCHFSGLGKEQIQFKLNVCFI